MGYDVEGHVSFISFVPKVKGVNCEFVVMVIWEMVIDIFRSGKNNEAQRGKLQLIKVFYFVLCFSVYFARDSFNHMKIQ